MQDKPVATNKKAFTHFHLDQRWECGIELKGGEVKSIRAGQVNFKDSFARIDADEAYLFNLHISPYKEAGLMNEEPDRMRKLLLRRKEIKKLTGLVTQKGFVLLPTKIYFNQRGFVKVEIALGKGKKLYDKRDETKKRQLDLALRRTLKGQRN